MCLSNSRAHATRSFCPKHAFPKKQASMRTRWRLRCASSMAPGSVRRARRFRIRSVVVVEGKGGIIYGSHRCLHSIYTKTCIHIDAYTNIHPSTHTYTNSLSHTHTRTYTHIHPLTHIHIHTNLRGWRGPAPQSGRRGTPPCSAWSRLCMQERKEARQALLVEAGQGTHILLNVEMP